MTLATVAEYVDCLEGGRTVSGHFRKVPSQASTAGWWADLSMASGNPLPNYYAATPLEASLLDPMRGIYHGDAQGTETYLSELMLCSPTAGFVGQYKLLDYLLYYPFFDGDDTDPQVMDNTQELTRYTDGVGVRAMAVAVAPTTGSGSFTFDYINQDGDAKTSPTQTCTTTAASITNLVTTQQAVAGGGNPFLTLAQGDTGIRSITSATMLGVNGGLVSLVLVKPILDHVIREINTPDEVMLVAQRAGLPRIYDGAYLGLIVNTAATIAAGLLTGRAKFAWTA